MGEYPPAAIHPPAPARRTRPSQKLITHHAGTGDKIHPIAAFKPLDVPILNPAPLGGDAACPEATISTPIAIPTDAYATSKIASAPVTRASPPGDLLADGSNATNTSGTRISHPTPIHCSEALSHPLNASPTAANLPPGPKFG